MEEFSRANGCMNSEGLLGKFTLRPLNSEDVPQIRVLCGDCFPIDYPDSWFKYISSGKVRNKNFPRVRYYHQHSYGMCKHS